MADTNLLYLLNLENLKRSNLQNSELTKIFMLVDGKYIADTINRAVAVQIKNENLKPKLVVITCDPNFETRKYLNLKQKKAIALGVFLQVEELPKDSTTETMLELLLRVVTETDGVIIQLPLPSQIDTEKVLSSIPISHDVDAFSYRGEKGAVLPPVVGAIAEIAKINNVFWKNKKVVVFGEGRLVGVPAVAFAESAGALVTVLNVLSTPKEVEEATLIADIIILGVGKSGLLTPQMIKEEVVVFDAGASEDGGLLVGDASPLVAEKASIFTPVPGGIGPITIALLFRNLLELKKRQ